MKTNVEELMHSRSVVNDWYVMPNVPAMRPDQLEHSALIRDFATYWAEFADAHPRQAKKFLAVRAVTLELSSKLDRTPT